MSQFGHKHTLRPLLLNLHCFLHLCIVIYMVLSENGGNVKHDGGPICLNEGVIHPVQVMDQDFLGCSSSLRRTIGVDITRGYIITSPNCMTYM